MIKIGMAFCGSFCTTEKATNVCKHLVENGYDVTPIFSEHVQTIDTRFGKCKEITDNIINICQNKPVLDIATAERIGPLKMFDILLLAPCTGNTLSKLALGITDNTVTMSTKSHLRNKLPVVVALATNDGLSGSANSLATLLNRKDYYFVPFGQDAPAEKPNSLVCDMNLIEDTILYALQGAQIQPILI